MYIAIRILYLANFYLDIKFGFASVSIFFLFMSQTRLKNIFCNIQYI